MVFDPSVGAGHGHGGVEQGGWTQSSEDDHHEDDDPEFY